MMGVFHTRPLIMGTHGVVTSDHYLATAAGVNVLQRGGNAIDAGVVVGFCMAVTNPQSYGIGGEVSILIYNPRQRKVIAVSGLGTAPRRATIEWFQERGIDLIPGDGFLPAVAPGAFDAWATILAEYGTMSLEQVLSPAIDLAENGFPMYGALRDSLEMYAERFRTEWPTSEQAFLPGGRIPDVGEVYRQPQWAATFRRVLEAERKASGEGRAAGIKAARDLFYKGEIAHCIVDFARSTEIVDATGEAHSGFLEYEDMAGHQTRIEEPVTSSYRGYQVCKCGPWSQGPVFLQQTNILEGYNLRQMGHNSVQYIHTVVEAAKLAFADREAYYGDPRFDDVPMDVLLSKEYAVKRRECIDDNRASEALIPGDVGGRPLPYDVCSASASGRAEVGDTVHLEAVDSSGWVISATPSGGWLPSSPVVADLGFCLGTRGQIFYLDPRRPNALQPGKRPRTTLTPTIVLKDGLPFISFGTEGGDAQDQWTLQFFLNVVDFGMDPQEAVEQPLFYSTHFPSSFYPRQRYPKQVGIEDRIPESVREGLSQLGHEVVPLGSWVCGSVQGIMHRNGVMQAGTSPRLDVAYGMGW